MICEVFGVLKVVWGEVERWCGVSGWVSFLWVEGWWGCIWSMWKLNGLYVDACVALGKGSGCGGGCVCVVGIRWLEHLTGGEDVWDLPRA